MIKQNILKDILHYSTLYLKSNPEILTPDIDAKYIISYVLNMTLSDLLIYKQKKINFFKRLKIKYYLYQRKKNKPIAYIIKHKEFYGINFVVSRGILIPRPETEFIIDEILKIPLKNYSLLDIGTGSGIIGITLKKMRPDINVTLSDINRKAIKTAKKNAKRILHRINKINFIHSNVFSKIKSKFNIIVSNPPYIISENIDKLMKDVKNFEPRIALDGGIDGMKFYRKIITLAGNFLYENGYLILELNPKLTAQIKHCLVENNFKILKVTKDYNNQERVVVAQIY